MGYAFFLSLAASSASLLAASCHWQFPGSTEEAAKADKIRK
jgi:hypothetical protein